MRRWWIAMLLFGALVVAGCGGGGDEDVDTDVTVTFADDGGGGGDDGGGGSDGSDGDSGSGSSGGSSSAGSGDFQTVFGLPPGNSVETDWSPYVRQESEFGVNESVVFEVTGATLDQIISHYEATLPAMGYVVGPRLEFGESIAINISEPDNPATTAVIQAGPTDDVITVNQNKTVPAADDSAGTTVPPAAVEGSSDGATE